MLIVHYSFYIKFIGLVPLPDFEHLSINVGYLGTWPGLTCKKATTKLLRNIIGELYRWNQNAFISFCFSLKRKVTIIPYLFLQESTVL